MGKPGSKSARLSQSVLLAENDLENLADRFAKEMNSGLEPEHAYCVSVPLEHRKRFGQFFTPLPVASLMADWILEIRPSRVLDPATGPGIFPRLLLDKSPGTVVTCIDLDEAACKAAKFALKGHPEITVLQDDFLTWSDESLFDAVIANPPYLRHHDLMYPYDIFALVGRKNHTRLSRLSNVYVLFILEICRRLSAGGRAAIIVPGEWVNANFGDTLKLWLISRGLLHTLIYFSHASSQFEDALTTASVLLLERPNVGTGRNVIRTIFVHEGCALETVPHILKGRPPADPNVVVQHLSPEQLLREKKWDHLLSHGDTETLPGFVPMADLAETRRGIATGSNSFFHLTPSMVKALRIRPENLIPCIGRAADVPGAIFREDDFERLRASDSRTYLFDLRTEPNEWETEYIRKGESEGLHERYLCAARNGNWYDMEARPPSAIWAAVFGREGLRFIFNSGGVSNLTTFHCVYPKNQSTAFAAALTACLNSRLVQGRARRQHRVYGGGLLKVEPRDLLDIEVPDLRRVGIQTQKGLSALLDDLDTAIRTDIRIEAVHDSLDAKVREATKEAALAQQQSLDAAGIDLPVPADRNHVGVVSV
jgi:adenine-specific DNA-methyltransferase